MRSSLDVAAPPMNRAIRRIALLALLPILGVMAGCNILGWLSHGLAGKSGEQTYQVEAQYLGLDGQDVAVMVAADEYTLYRYPGAPLAVSRAVSGKIAANVPNVTMMSPQEVIEFQHRNPYWSAMRYGELIQKLEVDRLVIIDLFEYRTHAPGNAHVWQGVISANVGVVEANTEDPDNFVFSTPVQARYPEESVVGLVNSDDQTVLLGMLQTFARDAAGLFYDHEVTK